MRISAIESLLPCLSQRHGLTNFQHDSQFYLISSSAELVLFHGQVFYHLGELDDALTYALGAGSLFDTSEQSEYVHCIIGGCYTLALVAAPANTPSIKPTLSLFVQPRASMSTLSLGPKAQLREIQSPSMKG